MTNLTIYVYILVNSTQPDKEWPEIERAINLTKIKKSRIAHLSGSINLIEDPLLYQRKIRNEWQISN